MGPFPVTPEGFRYLWVAKRLKTKGFERKYFAVPLKSKGRPDLRAAFEEMDRYFGLEGVAKLVKFDREGALIGNSNSEILDKKFFSDKYVELYSTISQSPNTGASPESVCRWFWEDARTCLWASGLMPGIYWVEAARVTVIHKNREHKVNEVVELNPHPLGRLGFCKMDAPLPKSSVKTVLVAFLGYDDITRGGVHVLWFDPRENRMRKTVVLDTGVVWLDEMAFVRKRANLKEWVEAFHTLGAMAPAAARCCVPRELEDEMVAYHVKCFKCRKDRTVSPLQFDFLKDKSWKNKVRCTDVGLDCVV